MDSEEAEEWRRRIEDVQRILELVYPTSGSKRYRIGRKRLRFTGRMLNELGKFETERLARRS